MPQASIAQPRSAPISVDSDGERLTAITIGAAPPAADGADDPLLREALAQLAAYFAGRLTIFDLPLAAATTPRGPAHRAAIVAIRHGETASYGELARAIGSSPRAIGQACRAQSVPDRRPVPPHPRRGAGDRPLFRRRGHRHQALAARSRTKGTRLTWLMGTTIEIETLAHDARFTGYCAEPDGRRQGGDHRHPGDFRGQSGHPRQVRRARRRRAISRSRPICSGGSSRASSSIPTCRPNSTRRSR